MICILTSAPRLYFCINRQAVDTTGVATDRCSLQYLAKTWNPNINFIRKSGWTWWAAVVYSRRNWNDEAEFFFYILDFLLSSEVANLRLHAHYAEGNTDICILYVEVQWLFCFNSFIRIGYCTWVEVDNFFSLTANCDFGLCLFREREFHIHMHFFFYYKVHLTTEVGYRFIPYLWTVL